MTQRASTFTLGAAVAMLLALPAMAKPIGATEERIPVTDPSLLEELGLDPGSTNIYVTPEVHAYLLMTPAERAAVEEAAGTIEDKAAFEAEASSAFGDTSGVSTIHASDFSRTSSTTEFGVGAGAFPGGVGTELQCFSGNASFFGVFRDLPHGVRATFPRIWYFDDDGIQDITVWLQRTCRQFSGGGTPGETTILRMNTSSGTTGYGMFGSGDSVAEDIDTHSCVYAVRARLGNGLNCAPGNQVRLLKATLSWHRQVSPAPVTATFDDVPTGHLFFQQIEALAASGITAGCDADSFCPSASLTRGQMAVFLATALGLNWEGSFWEPSP